MKMALELAQKGMGFTAPNPMVGAVIVKNGRVIGQGYHRKYGELHAEREALAACTEEPEGASIYVTLEPCCHYGKQPPCVNAILEAGTYAATGMGKQSPVIVVVQKPELIAKLSKMNAAVMGTTSDPFYGAPTVLIVLADPERGTYVEDGSLVMGNLMLAAHAVGVDSCWIHRAKEEFASPEGKALLKEWGLSENYVGIGHCILGYRDCEYPEAKERKADYIVRV